MKKAALTKIAAGLLTAAASLSAFAAPVNVGGVVWNPDAGIDFTSQSSLFETSIGLGGTLSGIGMVNQINGLAGFCSGCELTFEFGGFLLNKFNAGAGVGVTTDQLGFTGGWLKIYVDSTPNYNFDDKTTATDGTLWLDLKAVDALQTNGWIASLFGTIAKGTLGSGYDAGGGSGVFDVVGGLAAAYFDTDTVAAKDSTGAAYQADFKFSSSYQPNSNDYVTPDGYRLTGTGELLGNSRNIPEPGSLLLASLGMAGLGFFRRRSAK